MSSTGMPSVIADDQRDLGVDGFVDRVGARTAAARR